MNKPKSSRTGHRPPARAIRAHAPSECPDHRSEVEVLADLQAVCTQPGFVHALAYMCFRDNMILYREVLTPEDMRFMSDPSRLLRTEINTLIGLMVKAPIDWALPSPATLQQYVESSDKLLLELHHALSAAFSLKDVAAAIQRGEQINPFDSGAVMREPIFYAAESAYNFQYLDLAARRYAADADWLQANVGFTLDQACAVAESADLVNAERFDKLRDRLRGVPPDQWTMLPAFFLTTEEVAAHAKLPPELVERILARFALPADATNSQFVGLQDFNEVAAAPLLRSPGGEYVSLQNYALAEALYESPFYWMQADPAYRARHNQHRGQFTEEFVAERLARVFGAERVLTNIDIWRGKNKVAEIDVLVLWADRAIIVQAKSKRLTIEARKGGDQIIRDDFRKSVQDAYDQGLTCAEYLGDSRFRVTGADGSGVKLPDTFTEIYLFCVVSDHYPALSFQTHQFLKTREVAGVRAALVTDVFLIDVMTELLASPLHFLSYVARRARYGERLLAAQELTILGYHLGHNLWFDDEMSMIYLGEDFTHGVDVAMAVRRRGLPGAAIPEGILTKFAGTTIARVLQAIEVRPEPAVLYQGFQLLEMSGQAIRDLNRMIDQQALRAAHDGLPHDITMAFPDGSGLTVVCSGEADATAMASLASYCVRRKYTQKAATWFGLCLTSGQAQLRFGLRLAAPWQQDNAMDAEIATMPALRPVQEGMERLFCGAKMTPKTGRNDPCPCGSGQKYKKCCLG
ncbi:nuclease-related domain-containing protein [Xanthomonas campestris]|uniref:nuclease-related domain-containing protein n=1 Tax=Xanthomonas campestris TaxID=339 RepID=UPI000E1F8FC2|nr:nuclease-related domain-containing protein [Xanthomonas campestris]